MFDELPDCNAEAFKELFRRMDGIPPTLGDDFWQSWFADIQEDNGLQRALRTLIVLLLTNEEDDSCRGT